MGYSYYLRGFLDRSGRLVSYPATEEKKLIALRYLIAKFENGRNYSEKEVNAMLNQWHTFKDPALLRRELYDRNFFDREPATATYRKLFTPVLPGIWETERLTISDARESDAEILMHIFNANAKISDLDPTFQEYPLEEFTALIARSSGLSENPAELFRLQLLREKTTQHAVGYYHCSYRVPAPDIVFISMFVIHPSAANSGYGTECIGGISRQIKELLDYRAIRLNVFLRNWSAMNFWLKSGFSRIAEFRGQKEYSHDRHASLILEQALD